MSVEHGPDRADYEHLLWLAENSEAMAEAISSAVKHEPFPDDGVTYCGWHTGNGVVVDGCGEVWPCATARSKPVTS